jgi:hypothetical protein
MRWKARARGVTSLLGLSAPPRPLTVRPPPSHSNTLFRRPLILPAVAPGATQSALLDQLARDNTFKQSTEGVQPSLAGSDAMAPQDLEKVQQMLGLRPSKKGRNAALVDPIFVCIDCEAFEHNQHMITEIGVAVLDTRHIKDLDSTSSQKRWFKNIKYAHYRPVEYSHVRNKRFVKGCPDLFNFGPTTWIMKADAKTILKRIFQDPEHLADAANLDISIPAVDRNIVFVGHDAGNDEAYLRSVGFSMSADANVVSTVDTARAMGTRKTPVALRRLSLALQLQPVNLHNAGNDAAYTLQSAIMAAVKEHANPGSVTAELAKFTGKLPPFTHNHNAAPEIFAGTATHVPSKAAPASAPAAPRRHHAKDRRSHKQAVRQEAAAAWEGAAVSQSATASLAHLQKQLESSNYKRT